MCSYAGHPDHGVSLVRTLTITIERKFRASVPNYSELIRVETLVY